MSQSNPSESPAPVFTNEDEAFMRMALQACREGVQQGQTPFGACIVRAGEVLAVNHNRVWQTIDPTAHAEVNAIRLAAQNLSDISLGGATIYSTVEPCPMCFTAIHWSKIERIVYGAGIADAAEFGFSELGISNHDMKRLGGATLTVQGGLLREEALQTFRLWRDRPDHRTY
jgi:tRNA(Arg) A34 adenosine deaminase TadA